MMCRSIAQLQFRSERGVLDTAVCERNCVYRGSQPGRFVWAFGAVDWQRGTQVSLFGAIAQGRYGSGLRGRAFPESFTPVAPCPAFDESPRSGASRYTCRAASGSYSNPGLSGKAYSPGDLRPGGNILY